MGQTSDQVGVQENGTSPDYIKKMALLAIDFAVGDHRIPVMADVGGGRGDFAIRLIDRAERVVLLDYSPPEQPALPPSITPIQADLNLGWPLPVASVDFAVSLEVIEHVENPRHFFRELHRIVKPGGFIFLSTPNNHSASSVVTFLTRGQHRLFQQASYPAHITALLKCDLERISNEVGLGVVRWFWSNTDTIPRLRWRMPFRGKWFSDSVGVLYIRNE
jgi:2-polyprenyl-3-methyl-5-hydroxy-6-metoxy-1,4-benzoquinol methylase